MTIRNTQVKTINTQIFEAEGQHAVTTIIMCNVSTATVNVSLFAVPDGGNAGFTTQILNIDLPPKESFALDKERFVLDNLDSFWAQGSLDDAVTITISAVATE